MEYSFNVYNKSTNSSQTTSGKDVNELLQRVFKEYYYRGPAFFRSTAEQKRSEKEVKKELACNTTSQIQVRIEEKKDILSCVLMIDVDVWGYLLNEAKRDFTELPPEIIPLPAEPELVHLPIKPDKQSPRYVVRRSVLSYLFPSKYNATLKGAAVNFENDLAQWERQLKHAENENCKIQASYADQIKKVNADNERNLLEWNERKENYSQQRMSRIENQSVLRKEYENLDADAVEYYNKALLIQYIENNDFYEKDYDICYNRNNKVLTIDYLLPSSSDVSDVKEVKYNATQDIFEEKKMNKTEFQKYYEDIIYQITLRTIFTVFRFNDEEVIEAVVFNGYIKTIDKSTGQNIEPCILSVHAKRDIFEDINLSNVDPKSCFKNLKGISASNLATHAAVAPILTIDRKDKRFIDQKGIISDLDSELNLATMSWEDFEHLVSEIFEKEFSVNGGEVKVTRASRDGGVDAIAFDPDPIRGGKIVIQAKRYTNTVGVSAVRDLYGTVMNEGATKGILVTTADYGPDAYEFAKGKPLTLLNGANLLHLLEKHGHHAKIDLREAKKHLTEQNS